MTDASGSTGSAGPSEPSGPSGSSGPWVPPIEQNPLFLRWQDIPTTALGQRQAEMRRLADAARTIIDRLSATAAPTETITAAADALAGVADTFGTERHGTIYEGFAEAANAGGQLVATFDHSPFIGLANPLSPPVRLREVNGRVEAWATFGSAYEGPPGSVHGGYVAGAFDEVLGAAQTLSGAPGMTGTLTIRYRNPTPLHTEVHFVASYLRTEGRKIFTEGTLWAGDTLCAEAEAIFITIDFSRFAELMEARAEREQHRLK